MKIYFKHTPSYDKQTVYNSIREIAEFYNLKDRINSDTTILIKPNMLSGSHPDKAVTTHPVIVDCLIDLLKDYGARAKNITIGDSSGGVSNRAVQASNYRACGFAGIRAKQGANLYTKLEAVKVKTDGKIVKEFEIIAPAVNSDIIINLPKFKTHVMTGMSAAVKNMFGTVPGLKKAEFHMRFPDKEKFACMMVDLSLAVKPTLTIIDGVVAMEGDGPGGGNPRFLGFLMAGENSHYLDLAVADMMGFDPKALPILGEAILRNLVPDKLPDDLIYGDKELYNKIDNWLLPQSYRIDFGDRVPRAIRWATPTVEKILAPKPKIIKNKCIGCGQCAGICPQRTITIKDKKAVINMKNCIRCFCCHEMCPVKAIDVKRSILFNI